MRSLALSLVVLAAFAQRPTLEARFIGNMAFAISDGSVTLFSDFPYQSGYSVYMTYPADEIRSPTRQALSLITHRHGDHWEKELFSNTGWTVAGPPDVVAGLPQARVLTLGSKAAFGPIAIEPIPTPHHDVDHFSYVVAWHGRRLYFSGDTESPAHLAALEGLDVAFVSPWLYRTALTGKHRIDAKQIVIYHHQRGQTIPECRASCIVPTQGTTLRIP